MSETISNATCVECQHCGKYTNYASHAHHIARESELYATKEKLELAEKRISESQEQEPTVAIEVSDTGHRITWSEADQLPNGLWPMFIEPPIPPELAELQREMTALQSLYERAVEQRGIAQLENAELRKQLEVREGWQLVPIVPTLDMIDAAGVHYCSDEYTGLNSTFTAMLKAAPKP